MQRYKNLSGNSGVYGYELGNTYIKVYFLNNSAYLYDYHHTGTQHVEEMKRHAIMGIGLNTFISQVVRKKYAAKLENISIKQTWG